MNSYMILQLQEYDYAIIATSYVNPLDDIDTIEQDFKNMDFSGNILFDLLLCNGLNVNRYVQIYFNGERFEHSSLKMLQDVSQDTKKRIYTYLNNNSSFIESSILPDAQRYLIQNGKII